MNVVPSSWVDANTSPLALAVYALAMWNGFWQDVRHAVRHVRRSPAFATTAVVVLAVGLGVNAAMFTLLDGLLLRPLRVPEPSSLVGVSGRGAQGQLRLTLTPVVSALASEGPLRSVCGYNGGALFTLDVGGHPVQAAGAFVTGSCFDAFGVAPALGRPITPDDAPIAQPGRAVAVISYRLWRRAFGGDPAALGRTFETEGVTTTLVGVLPEGFAGLHADGGIDVFMPFGSVFPPPAGRPPGASHIVGRLKSGTTFDGAAAELASRWASLLDASVPSTLSARERADLLAASPRVERIAWGISGLRDLYGRSLRLVSVLTISLLFLTCVNVGGLVVSRLAARGPEFSVRTALGSSRARLARQVLLEVIVMTALATVVAVPLAVALVNTLVALLPDVAQPRMMTFGFSPRVLVAMIAIGAMTAFVASLAPAVVVVRPQLRPISASRAFSHTTGRTSRLLLALQVAVSLILVVSGTLLVRSLYELRRFDTGIQADQVLYAHLAPLPNAYNGLDLAAYYPALVERLTALPGVRRVGLSRMFPLLTAETAGQPLAFVGSPDGDTRGVLESASPGYFEALGIPLLAGRLPAWTDTATSPAVAIVSASVTRALGVSPADAIGRRLRLGAAAGFQDIQVVGVVADASHGNPRDNDPPMVYRPTLQLGAFATYPNLVLAYDGDTAPLAAAVREAVETGGREFVQEILPLSQKFAMAPVGERIGATLAGVIAGLACLIAAVGVYGVLAHAVTRRTREIGVRMAVGASHRAIAALVVREGLGVALVGIALGAPSALAATRVFRGLLFGVSAADPATYLGAAVALALVAVGAAVMPAHRAAAVDPAVALRAE